MLATFDVHASSAQEIAPASATVARAYFDDPAWEHILPSAEQRARDLPWLIDLGFRYADRYGRTFVTGSPVCGAAVWLPPGETTVTPDRLDEVGFAAAPARLGPEAFARFDRYIWQLGARHAALASEPHWYLIMLAVDAGVRRRGAGSLLLQPVLEQATRDRVPCYLETAREENLAFFARHGFRVAGELSLADWPRTWLMRREPVDPAA